MTTLLEIKNYMLDKLPVSTTSNNDWYDEDGYSGDLLYDKIRSFWLNFESDSSFRYLVSGTWITDEVDLAGGRDYFLSDDKLINMVFDYMYNQLGWNQDDYEKIIYNSVEFVDDLLDKYGSLPVIRDSKIGKIVDKNNDNFFLMKYHPEMKSNIENIQGNIKDCFEYIGISKIDGGLVYKIKLPKGKIIENLDSYI